VRTLVLNGDSSEERLRRVQDVAKRQIDELKALCADADVELVMLRGNHDPHGPTLGSLDLCDGQIFITHGDILFRDVSPWSRKVELAHRALEKIEKEYPEDYRDDLEMTLEVSRRVILEMSVHQPKAKHGFKGRLKTMFSQAWPPTRPLKIIKVWMDTPRLTRELRDRYRPEAKVMVVGHTHRAFVSQSDGKFVINTGAFLPLAKALAIDVEQGQLQVRRIREESGEFVIKETLETVDLQTHKD